MNSLLKIAIKSSLIATLYFVPTSLFAASAHNSTKSPESVTFAPQSNGELANHWINGEDCKSESPVQIHRYNRDFYILRQSVCTNFEAPFMYLLFGDNKVLMQDTGASDVNLVQVVDGIIDQWLSETGKSQQEKAAYQLLVTHSHGHGDHVFGDSQFKKRGNTTVVGKDAKSVIEFFDFKSWPQNEKSIELGNRQIQILPIPGHHPSHIALYDPATALLFTGDSFYPGRLYFRQATFDTYKQSMQRLESWIANKPVKYVLGTHIEMTQESGKDYPFEAAKHLNERRLPLSTSDLKKLTNGLQLLNTPVKQQNFGDFILYPLD